MDVIVDHRTPSDQLIDKWSAVLDAEKFPAINGYLRKQVTAKMLENTELAVKSAKATGQHFSFMAEGLFQETPTNVTGTNISNYDPLLIALVRRTMPNLIAYDVCGVQPMTGPTGLIFAFRPRYTNQTGTESWYNEVNTAFSSVTAGNSTPGQGAGNIGGILPAPPNTATTGTVVSGNGSTYNYGGSMPTSQAEALGSSGNVAYAEMAFSIDKTTVQAGSRALKATYSMELAQDLKVIHGLDAETELANMLSGELLAEINREIIRTIILTAVQGATEGTTTQGTFDLDTDSNGRWSEEKFKGLYFQLSREANALAKQTRRGKGNIIICSSDVASALDMTGKMTYTPDIKNNLQVDDTGNTFAGVLANGMRVYIDPYAAGQYAVVGYKGRESWDAGLFYCPYVPAQMVRAVGQDDFQPRIGFKTRYGVVANPFAQGLTVGSGAITQNSNVYYRRILINNLF